DRGPLGRSRAAPRLSRRVRDRVQVGPARPRLEAHRGEPAPDAVVRADARRGRRRRVGRVLRPHRPTEPDPRELPGRQPALAAPGPRRRLRPALRARWRAVAAGVPAHGGGSAAQGVRGALPQRPRDARGLSDQHAVEVLRPSGVREAGMSRTTHILNVDVEDWFHVLEADGAPSRDEWASLESRVERNTDALLELFDRKGAKATFFVVGWVAARHGALVRRIAAAGHELASHSFWHEVMRRHDRASLRADLAASRKVLEDAM